MNTNLGGPNLEDLRRTLLDFPRAGADEDMPDDVRFVRNVAGRLRLRLSNSAAEEQSHALFLLTPYPPDALAGQATRHYAIDDGETAFADGAWFVSQEVVLGQRLQLGCTFDEIFELVEAWEMGDVPAVTFRSTAAGPLMRFYPQGLSKPEIVVVVHLGNDVVTLDAVLALVDRIHETTLVSPSAHAGGAKLWQNRAKYFTASQVEVAIQAYVRCGLAAALPNCEIEIEQNSVAGRLDVEILQATHGPMSSPARQVILELKVLRDFGSKGNSTSPAVTQRWVSSGVTQAHAYRVERGAKSSALCCFDMRRDPHDEQCLLKVQAKAHKLSVVVRRWPIFPSDSKYRDWLESLVEAG